MKGVKQGFIHVGKNCYVREDAIAAVIFTPAHSQGDATVNVHLQGAEKLQFIEPGEIEQLREYVTKPRPLTERDIGMGPNG